MRAQYTGRVASYDDHRGRGEIEVGDSMHFPFHCTAIADGTRTIAEGAAVRFRLVIGPLGGLEATSVAPT